MRFLIAAFIVAAAACTSAPQPIASTPPKIRSDYLNVPGGRLYFEESGTGAAVVLIHGGFGDRRMWDAQFDALARDFRVVRYDHRGFGNSTGADSAYSPTADLIRLLDHLGIAKAHVIGNSVGGTVALDFALLHPERTNKVVVVASGASGYPWRPEDVASIVAVFNTAKEQGADKAAELWLHNDMIAVSSRHPRSADLVARMVRDNKNIFKLNAWPEESLKPSTYDRLGELRMPVLFVVGQNDVAGVQRVNDASAARIGGSEVFRMPGADHLPHMTHPDEFNRRVTAFLER
jgi:3-oxoadipate enol-lactonase